MPSIVGLAYESYWKKIQQFATITQNETMKQIPQLTRLAQREAIEDGNRDSQLNSIG